MKEKGQLQSACYGHVDILNTLYSLDKTNKNPSLGTEMNAPGYLCVSNTSKNPAPSLGWLFVCV